MEKSMFFLILFLLMVADPDPDPYEIMRFRIQKVKKYTDLDPQHCLPPLFLVLEPRVFILSKLYFLDSVLTDQSPRVQCLEMPSVSKFGGSAPIQCHAWSADRQGLALSHNSNTVQVYAKNRSVELLFSLRLPAALFSEHDVLTVDYDVKE
jgi:hypothetical protein